MITDRPLSNGTDLDIWLHQWCYRCDHDHNLTHPNGPENGEGCPITARLVAELYPIEALSIADDGGLVCEDFTLCAPCYGQGPEIAPAAVPPIVQCAGQLDLFGGEVATGDADRAVA